MNKKILLVIVPLIGLIILISTLTKRDDKREPIIITSNASYIEMTLDTLITEADLIVIGNLDTIHPSRWNTLDGKLPEGITVQTISPDKVIFTDVDFNVNQPIKDQSDQNTVRIRSLGGIVGQDQMIVSSVAPLEMGKTYLLFLGKDTGSTADINPGHYFVRGGFQGLYEIIDGKAISGDGDEWVLEELLAYIEKSLFAEEFLPTSTSIPNDLLTPSSTSTSTPTEPSIETPLLFTDTPAATDLPTQTPTPTETANPTP